MGEKFISKSILWTDSQNDHGLRIKSAGDLDNDCICQEIFNFWIGNRALIHGVKEQNTRNAVKRPTPGFKVA